MMFSDDNLGDANINGCLCLCLCDDDFCTRFSGEKNINPDDAWTFTLPISMREELFNWSRNQFVLFPLSSMKKEACKVELVGNFRETAKELLRNFFLECWRIAKDIF